MNRRPFHLQTCQAHGWRHNRIQRRLTQRLQPRPMGSQQPLESKPHLATRRAVRALRSRPRRRRDSRSCNHTAPPRLRRQIRSRPIRPGTNRKSQFHLLLRRLPNPASTEKTLILQEEEQAQSLKEIRLPRRLRQRPVLARQQAQLQRRAPRPHRVLLRRKFCQWFLTATSILWLHP